MLAKDHTLTLPSCGTVGLAEAEDHLVHLAHLAPVATDEAGAGALSPADIPECACHRAYYAHVHAIVEDGAHDDLIQGKLALHEQGARTGTRALAPQLWHSPHCPEAQAPGVAATDQG